MQIGQFCQQGMSSLASCLQKRLEMRVWDENVFNLFQLMQNSTIKLTQWGKITLYVHKFTFVLNCDFEIVNFAKMRS